MAAPIVVIGGIYLVNSSGTPTAGGAATAAATTPFAIRRNWRPMPTEPIVIPGAQTMYPDIHYEPVADPPIPISVIGSSHENAVARLQELQRVLARANSSVTLLEIQPTSSSTSMYAEISSGFVRLIQEEESGFEGWEGFIELHAEIVYLRSAFFARIGSSGIALVGIGTVTNTGTGANANVRAFGASLDGDLANEGQPTLTRFQPTNTISATIFYIASIYSRTYSTTSSGAKTTSSTTGASSALNIPTMTDAWTRMGIKARVLFRFTNNTSNVRVRVEMRGSSSGTLLYAGAWITPTAGSATLYDMGQIPLSIFRASTVDYDGTLQLYIGYKSSDGASATATLGYNEFLLYYDFCRIDSPTAITTSLTLDVHGMLRDTSRAGLPLDAPVAFCYDSAPGTIIDHATIRGRPPRAIEGGSVYFAWCAANNVHDTTRTGNLMLNYSPLWRTLRGND